MTTVRPNQHVNIEIDVIEDTILKCWRHIDVAIVVSKAAVGQQKPKNVVPAVEPVVFVRDRSARDKTEIRMVNVKVKFARKNQQ